MTNKQKRLFDKKKYLTPVWFYSKIHKVAAERHGQGVNMDRIYEQTMLFDFYGELLTEHQRRVYEDAVYHDMSLGEIAEELCISRQGVHDLLRRCSRILQGYEDKLHLVERFAKAKEIVSRIEKLTEENNETAERMEEPSIEEQHSVEGEHSMEERLKAIRELSIELLEEL